MTMAALGCSRETADVSLKGLRRWVWILIVAGLVMPHHMADNQMSRYAASSAFCRTGSFVISDLVRLDHPWTHDWARTPDGRYFSNKAPAPILLGTPVACLLQRILLGPELTAQNQFRVRYPVGILLSLLFQLLPFAWGSLRLFRHLKLRFSLNENASFLVGIALLFGHTASIFMGTWFGHGFVVAAVVWTMVFFLESRFFAMGLALGLAIGGEYSSALLIPGFLAAVGMERVQSGPNSGLQTLKAWLKIAIGGLIAIGPVLVYQKIYFGSPFSLPYHFQNPIYVDLKDQEHAFLGLFHALPVPRVILELLFGGSRGILFTQPWILMALGASPWLWKKLPQARPLFLFSVPSLIFLLLMNASFGQWHAGASAGPRYLSAALVTMIVPFAAWISLSTGFWRRISSVAVFYAWLFYVLAMSSSCMLNDSPALLLQFVDSAVHEVNQFWPRFIALSFATIFAWRRQQKRKVSQCP